MHFFSGNRQSGQIGQPASLAQADNIILNAGRIADETMLDCFTESRAFWAAYRRKETERLEKEYPGYREELNRQRALAGLPPI